MRIINLLRQYPLRVRILAALITIIITVIAVWGVFSYSISLVGRGSRQIITTNVPNAIGGLTMLDALNDMHSSLVSYVNGDPDARSNFFEHTVRFRDARKRLDTSVINDTTVMVIDTLFQATVSDANEGVFERFKPYSYDESVRVALNLRRTFGEQTRANINRMVETEISDANGVHEAKHILDDDLPGIVNYMQLWVAISDMLTALDQFVLQNPEAAVNFFHSSLTAENILINLRALEQSADEIIRLDVLTYSINQLRDAGEYVFDSQDTQAKQIANTAVKNIRTRHIQRIASRLESIVHDSENEIVDDLGEINGTLHQAKLLVDGIIIVAFGLTLFASFFITKQILAPLGSINSIISQLRAGRYDTDFHVKRGMGEIDEVFKGLEIFQRSLVELEELRSSHLKKVEARHLSELQNAFDDLKKSEENIRAQNKKMAKINAELEQFVHIASHDLREPMKNISGYVHMLAMTLDKNDMIGERDRAMKQIQAASARMCGLIDNLRELTKTGEPSAQFTKVMLDDILSEVIENHATSLHEKQTVFNLRALPVVEGHPKYLRQLFQILVDNAVKYGATPLVMRVNAKSDADAHHIIFSTNHGVEFTKDQSLLLPFRRGQNCDSFSSGIGLALAKKIVEEIHYGQISVDEKDTKKFTVNIILPTAKHLKKLRGEQSEQ